LGSLLNVAPETFLWTSGATESNNLAILGAARQRAILFHVDGAQAAGKIRVDLSVLPVNLYSLTAHKFYGPKGVGALFVADGTSLQPLMFGGGQQQRLRPGTLPVDLIAGLGAAAAVATTNIEEDLTRLTGLKRRLLQGIKDIEGLQINGPSDGGYPGILNVGLDDVDGESLLLAMEPLCVATGSACNSRNQEPSSVLRALGRSDREAQSAIRFSLGRPTTDSDIEMAISSYQRAVRKLRELAPERVV
jgi:cysteine desulfurase